MSKWRTRLYLYGEKIIMESSEIEYFKGILQGDILSLILFVLSVNPLSFMLHKEEGYKIGKEEKTTNLSHLFFVDDLKLYALKIEKLIALLELVIQVSQGIGMVFGESKCAYQCIQWGKKREMGLPLKVKDLTVAEIEEGDRYKYLGIDESVGYDSPLNKYRIIKEYKRRVNKIWKSEELNAANKSITYNSFAIPIITPSIGILNWTKGEIKSLDVATSKLLTMNRAFHQSSDLNRLYVRRAGGRGRKNIEDMYECRTISLLEHLEEWPIKACKTTRRTGNSVTGK